MTYTAISDFKYGMDRRRPQTSGVPGTLWILKNAVITRGGDIERAKKFAQVYSLPAGTVGLYPIKRQLFVFGSAATPGGMPTGVQYQQLAAPSTPTLNRIYDAKGFNGQIYAIAGYDDGNIYHFYNGSRVTAWDALADAAFDYTTVATRLAELIDAQSAFIAKAFGNTVEVTAAVAGTSFTSSGSASDVDADASLPTCTKTAVQANVAAVTEVRATATLSIDGGSSNPGVNRIVDVKANGVSILNAPVDWSSSNDVTANALAVEINNLTSSGYTASAVGALVTITAPVGLGATANGYVLAVTTAGDVLTTPTNFAGGVTAVAAVAQVDKFVISAGTPDSTDSWTITLNGTAYKTTGRASATGLSAYVHKSRVYSLAGALEYYCKINDPTDWTAAGTASSGGKINVSNEAEGSETLVGQINYSDMTAIFSRTNIVLFHLNADATTNSIDSTVGNTGTIAQRSIVEFGASDVYYLDESGIRSLQTRQAVDAAFASDVGSAIDPFMQSLFSSLGNDLASKACAVVESTDGRYMLAIGQYIIVLSFFPSSKITAWSYIDFGATISDLVRAGRDTFLRSGNVIYQYGGSTGDVYPSAGEFPVLAETPFISSKDPAGIKQLEGFDMAASNVWHVEIMVDPNDTTQVSDAGYIDGTTYARPQHIKAPGHTSHFGLRMTCSEAGYASLSSTAVHSDLDERQ